MVHRIERIVLFSLYVPFWGSVNLLTRQADSFMINIIFNTPLFSLDSTFIPTFPTWLSVRWKFKYARVNLCIFVQTKIWTEVLSPKSIEKWPICFLKLRGLSELQKSWRILITYESSKIHSRPKIGLMVKKYIRRDGTFSNSGTAKARK